LHSAANFGALSEKVKYAIDPATSKFVLHVFAGGWLAVFAHNLDIAIQKYEGEIQLDPEAIDRSALTLRIEAASLSLISRAADRDRVEIERIMQEQVLNSQAFPEIIYESAHAKVSSMSADRYWMALQGDLLLRDVRQPQSISTAVTISNGRLRAVGEFSLLQTQFGIKPISNFGGGLAVKDELKFNFDIMAQKS